MLCKIDRGRLIIRNWWKWKIDGGQAIKNHLQQRIQQPGIIWFQSRIAIKYSQIDENLGATM